MEATAIDRDEPATAPAEDTKPEESAPAGAPVAVRAPRSGARPPRKAAKRESRPALTPEQRAEARDGGRRRLLAMSQRRAEQVAAALDLLEAGKSIVYVARFGRVATGGMDLRALRALRDHEQEFRHEEERRIELRELLRSHGALDEKTEHRLRRANGIPAMEDIAAPYLPVVAGRATVARGAGLEPLAELIRRGESGTVLAELTSPFVKEGGEPASLDEALAGARDILAEELSLDAELRARLRKVVKRDAVLEVSLRAERKGDPGRYKSLVGFRTPVSRLQPLRFLTIRRGEKERVLVATIEPAEELVLPILHKSACAENHPHVGFLRAAAEDGYRRILRPMFQAEVRGELKRRADAAAIEGFERNLRHRLLGPVGGPRSTLGLRADVTGGHRWCATDEDGLPTGCGTLPHEGTAGREACLAELAQILTTYEIAVIAVGSGAGRAAARSLADAAAAAHEPALEVVVVFDGGTHALEAQGKLEVADRPEVPAECRGALSLARRFQDPLRELVGVDPKALALGPNLHDVHQGRLRVLLDETVRSCVAHVGVDPNVAPASLLAHVPGFHPSAAHAFVAWREAHGPLIHKAALAAVPGVGTEVAEQAVGFLRLPEAEDPRDRSQLHPAQYAIVERMAAQVGAEVRALVEDPTLRARVRLADLEGDESPLPVLKYVLYQITAGHLDERPKYTSPIPPPPGLKLETLQPGLVLEGRVVRAMPFGIFVDVGLETDALIPTPHIGIHPGIEPATVAPIGAVVQARVLEVIPERRRLTLSMRPDRAIRETRGPRRDRGGRRGEGRREEGRSRPSRPARKPSRKAGKYGGTGGVSDIFSGRRRDERGAPRQISLGPDDGKKKPKDTEAADEKALSEEELLARKLADLQKKFGGDR